MRTYLVRAALYALRRRRSSLAHLSPTEIDALAEEQEGGWKARRDRRNGVVYLLPVGAAHTRVGRVPGRREIERCRGKSLIA